MYLMKLFIFILVQINSIYTDFSRFSDLTIGIIDISKKIDPIASYEIDNGNIEIKKFEKLPLYFTTTKPTRSLFYPNKIYHVWNNYVPLYKKKQVPYKPMPTQKKHQSYVINPNYNINRNGQKSGRCDERLLFQSDPNDCRKYTVCTSGRLLTMSCPKFLVFDPILKSCNYSKYVNGKCGTDRFFY